MGTLSLTLPVPGSTLNNLADAELVSALTAIQNAINGNIDGVNAPTLETAFSTYKTVFGPVGDELGAVVTATYLLANASAQIGSVQAGSGSAVAKFYPFYFDPADWAASPRTTKLRVRAQVITNAVAPTVSYTTGLYPVATWGGASGASPTVATISAVVTGSTVAITTPSANTANQGNSGDFTAPASGWYVLAVVPSGTAAANSLQNIEAYLQMRQV
jgi:hypothetical protein